MPSGRDALRWSPRLSRDKLQRLYEQEARGIYNEALLDEVGICLYLRCRDILTIAKAHAGRHVRCPVCDVAGRETFITRHGDLDEILRCPACGWEIVWLEYMRSYRRRQLNIGGAGPAFRTYMAAYERARTPRAKMLAIDALIHAFHYSLRDQPDLPTRPVLPNLIDGSLSTLVPFLDALTAGTGNQQASAPRRAWEREMAKLERFYAEGRPPKDAQSDPASDSVGK